MNRCHELMNEALDAHRTKATERIQYAIAKYQEALNNVPENGTIMYPVSRYNVHGGNNIRSEIWTHIGYAYHDLTEPHLAKEAYDTALRYNPNNQDAKFDRIIPHRLNARYINQGVSGPAKYGGGSLCGVIIIENENIPTSVGLTGVSGV